MPKTTIDGLTARTSTRRKVARSAAVCDILPSTKRMQYAMQPASAMPTLSRKAVAAARDDFAQNSTTDWAEILDDIASEAPSTAATRTLASQTTTNNTSRAAAHGTSRNNTSHATSDTTSSRTTGHTKTMPMTDSWAELLATQNELKAEEAAESGQSKHDGRARRQQKNRQQKAAAGRKKHLGAIIAIILAIILIGGGVAVYVWGDSLIAKLTGGQSGLMSTISAIVSDEVPFLTDENGRTNVLIFGTEGYNMSGETATGTHDGAQLTDSIMVASFNQETKDVALISLPRDLKVSRACSAGKINEVFWCHNMSGEDEAAGAKALEQQIEEILGIDIQYYAHVNWASLIDIIDTIGGITVTLDEDINDYNYTGAVAQAGVPITVNGEQALGLARARHGTTGGDFTRGSTQQKIVAAIAEKLVTNGVSVTEALSLFNILGDNLRSNFSTNNIKAAVRMISGFDVANIRQVPLIDYDKQIYYMTTATINEISYVVPAAGVGDYSEIQQYIAQMFNNDPVVREAPKVAVYNATETLGLASTEAEELQAANYIVVKVGDAELGSCTQKVCLYVLNDTLTASQAALEQRYELEALPATEMPAELWTGTADLVIILGQEESSQ